MKSLWTENPEGEPVRLLRLADEQEEADAVAGDIARLLRAGERVPRDIAIFYRLNSQSRALETALRGEASRTPSSRGPSSTSGGRSKTCCRTCGWWITRRTTLAWSALRTCRRARIGDLSLKRVKAWGAAHGLTLLDALARAEEAGVRGPRCRALRSFGGSWSNSAPFPAGRSPPSSSAS